MKMRGILPERAASGLAAGQRLEGLRYLALAFKSCAPGTRAA